QLVDPLLRRAVQEAPRTALVDRALQDVDAADLGGVAARGRRGVVEAALPVREPFRRDERRRRDPAVRGAPGEVDALRPGHAEPDADLVLGRGTALPGHEAVVVPLEAQPALVAPVQPDDVHGLLKGAAGRGGAEPPGPVRLDVLPRPPRAEAQLDAAAAEPGHRRDGL